MPDLPFTDANIIELHAARRSDTARSPALAGALQRFLNRLLLRSDLTCEECDAVLALPGHELSTAAHRDIARPGQTFNYACLIADGIAGRFDQLASGHRQITALHIAGDMCDLHSVPVPQAGWGIESLNSTLAFRIPHDAIKELIVRYPSLALAFWRDTIVDASILAKWNSALGRRSAKARLAHLICEMGIRKEHAGLGTRNQFNLPITQAQLADVLGLTAVHLNRTFQALRRDSLLFTDGSAITIPDRDKLCEVAEFDTAYLLAGENP